MLRIVLDIFWTGMKTSQICTLSRNEITVEDQEFVDDTNPYRQRNAQIWNKLVNSFTNVSFTTKSLIYWHKSKAN